MGDSPVIGVDKMAIKKATRMAIQKGTPKVIVESDS